MFLTAQEVRYQALRLADRQPRQPRTVPPEEEQAGAICARHERAWWGLGKGIAMACASTRPGDPKEDTWVTT